MTFHLLLRHVLRQSATPVLIIHAALFTTLAAVAQEPAQFTQDQLNFFENRIRPVLVEHCLECHSASSRPLQGGLLLDSRVGVLTGGDSGPAVLPSDPAGSLLLKALRHDGLEMPPDGKLPDQIISDFETWIRMGIPDPRTANAPTAPRVIDLEAGRRHWAFQPVVDAAPPGVTDAAWPADPVDQFVLAALEKRGLRPAPDTDPHTWLRRVTLDLTGLPPTPEDIRQFIADPSATARERIVDRLLASRAYAERWARHWLDLTGYADQVGTSNEVFAEHAWRYRDYCIDAFNSDKPWDQFVIEQLAGDLLPHSSTTARAAAITATGFLLVGDVEIVNPDKLKLETDHIDFQLNRIGTAFMGMTLSCARCHDHKFDPIGLDDYYAIAGTLRSTISTRKIDHGIWSGLNVVELPETPEQIAAREKHTATHQQHIENLKAEQTRLQQELAELDQLEKADQPAKADQPTATQPGSPVPTPPQSPPPSPAQPPGGPPDTAAIAAQRKARRQTIQQRLGQIPGEIRHAEFFAPAVPRAFAVQDAPEPGDMAIAIRGNPYAVGRVVPRGVLRVAAWDSGPAMPANQSGRLELARWIADPRNPTTPRVTVNRIWQKLFGEGIVRTVDYFGTRGEQPTHPELLDHLAARFIKSGWSHKAIVRTIVLSRTYQQSGAPNPAAESLDPDNRLLWKMPARRLEAEAIRDCMLAVSGELQPCAGGPGLPLEYPENTGNLQPKSVNPPSFALKRFRPEQEFQRTLYLPVVRSSQKGAAALRDLFDFPQPNGIAGRRSETVVATQALYLLNNELPRRRATALAEKIMAATPNQTERLEQLWLHTLARPISPPERADAEQFLAEQQATPAAWTELCLSLLASNEFLYRL
jgi:hypothetical protein